MLSGVTSGTPVMLVGPRGCGKSCVSNDLVRNLDPDQYLPNVTLISGASTASQIQKTIVGRLDRRRKGVFGPPMGRKCVLLVDDLDLSPGPAHLIRQWLGHGHWYSEDNTKLELVDTVSQFFLEFSELPRFPRFC
jgi:dynein heavy chain, axonemal